MILKLRKHKCWHKFKEKKNKEQQQHIWQWWQRLMVKPKQLQNWQTFDLSITKWCLLSLYNWMALKAPGLDSAKFLHITISQNRPERQSSKPWWYSHDNRVSFLQLSGPLVAGSGLKMGRNSTSLAHEQGLRRNTCMTWQNSKFRRIQGSFDKSVQNSLTYFRLLSLSVNTHHWTMWCSHTREISSAVKPR